MKNFLLSFAVLLLTVATLKAQTVILDFEAAPTSTVFQYFGSTLDGTTNQVIDNPNKSGLNTSTKVGKFVKPAVAEVWAGAFSNPNPTTLVDLSAHTRIAVKVHMDHIGSLSVKLEGSGNGGPNWLLTQPNTKINEWEELIFDVSVPSLEDPRAPAAGFSYARVVLFFDFGKGGTGTDVTSYFDDIRTLPASVVTVPILDFETAATGTKFQYFGSPLDGTFTEIVDNPKGAGLNTSSKVLKYVKPAVAEVWAGAFSNPNPTTLIDLSGGGKVCVKVHMDHIGNLALKLEGSTSGKPNWITKVANTKVNEWEELCFDASVPSLEPPFEAADGSYERLVVFFDFGTAGTGSEVVSYFDDVVVKRGGGIVSREVKFKVDMNRYTSNFDKVYVSGSFNNWSGDANPLTDTDLDGVWEGSVKVPNGTYEYKITLDNWKAQEEFAGFEECTRRDASGQFVNRLLLVGGDVTVPTFCFNSCYACGEEIKMTFKLGMGTVAPSADGVWLAGGGNFDVPGGRYKMSDANNDKIYEIVIPRKRGFRSYYTFTNGNCPDYSCKENLAGLPCGNPANFNDRLVPQVTKDTVIATCFGACFTNAQCVSSVHSLLNDTGLFELNGNPTGSGQLLLRFAQPVAEDAVIWMTNTSGQIIGQWKAPLGATQWTPETAHLPAGLYFVTVRTDTRQLTRKFVK